MENQDSYISNPALEIPDVQTTDMVATNDEMDCQTKNRSKYLKVRYYYYHRSFKAFRQY